MLIPIGLILVGFVLLMFSAEYTVRGSVAIANKLNIPTIIIGLTIVAFGTSAPEFVVSIRAAFSGAAGISIGNVIGSNIANILFILGATAVIYPITCKKENFLRDFSFLIIVTIVFTAFALTGSFVMWQGLVMLAMLVAFIVYNYKNSKNTDEAADDAVSPIADRSWLFVSVVTILGLVGIIFGADLLVKGAVSLARILGVSEEIIGLTIVAFGTSLPELATSGMAAFRRQNDVALGNVVGSNIWNIVFIMGATSSLVDVNVPAQFLNYDIWVMLGATLVLSLIMFAKNKMSKVSGIAFILAYFVYLASQVLIANGTWIVA